MTITTSSPTQVNRLTVHDSEPPSSRLFTVAVILGYVALGFLAFWPLLPWTSQRLFGSNHYFGQYPDTILASWFLAWVPHSIAHGLNPFFSQALYVPTGVNLAQNTEGPLLGFLTWPLSVALGPVARANFLMVLAMPASATAAYVVLRRWKVWAPAAALGGLLYGFSPYAVGASLAHVVLVFLPFVPFIVMIGVDILCGRGTLWRKGVVLGLLVAAQYFCSPEIMASVAVLFAWGILCAAVLHRDRIIAVAKAALPAIVTAVATSAVLLGYPIWMMLRGPQHYTGAAQPPGLKFYNDAFSFVAPGPLQRFTFFHFLPRGTRGNASETAGYIGIALLFIALMLFWRSRRSPRMQIALAVLIGAAVLSLGPRLAIGGTVTPIPLPFALLVHLPLLNNLLAVRFSFEMDACLAAVVAFGLDDLRRRPVGSGEVNDVTESKRWLILAGVALVVAVTLLPQWPYPSTPARALPASVAVRIPQGDPVAITYPYASKAFPRPMLWQLEQNFSFRLTGGYATHPGPGGKVSIYARSLQPPALERFLERQEGYVSPAGTEPLTPLAVGPALISATRQALVANNVRVIIVDRSVHGSRKVVKLFTRTLGRPTAVSGKFVLWTR